MNYHHDILITGAGCVGLSLAIQLRKKFPDLSIAVLEKENSCGQHSSGRNSGVLHSGIYYPPNSLKAKVCIPGGRRLKEWIIEHKLPLLKAGKLVVPHKVELDSQIDMLRDRAIKNGAEVEILDSNQISDICKEVRSTSGRALWSPNTSVTSPKKVVEKMYKLLLEQDVCFYFGAKDWRVGSNEKEINISQYDKISFGYMFNCCGLYADKVAHMFNIGTEYRMVPFKGIYWQLQGEISKQIKTNIYPVPDLNVPFLGVHFTPSAAENNVVSIGPTAVLALGRENYNGIESINPLEAIKNIATISNQYISNSGGFRKYVHDQAFLSIKPLMMKDAKMLIPSLKDKNVIPSKKVGIRAQLYNETTKLLENDFISMNGPSSTHVLNAVSPAFTASFELADLILKRSNLSNS